MKIIQPWLVLGFSFVYFSLFFVAFLGVFTFLPHLPFSKGFLIRASKYLHIFLISAQLLAIPLLRPVLLRINTERHQRLLSALSILASVIFLVLLNHYIFFLVAIAIIMALYFFTSLKSDLDKKNKWVWVYWAASGGLVLWAFYFSIDLSTPYPYALHEDSMHLGVISQVLLGKTPYRDISIQFGFLSDVIRPLIAYKFNGINYGADLIFRGWIGGIASTLAFLFIAGSARLNWFNLLIGLLVVNTGSFIVPERAIFSLLSVFGLVILINTAKSDFPTSFSKWISVLSGIMMGLQFFYSFEVGITHVFGMILFAVIIAKNRREESFFKIGHFFWGGFAGVLGLFFLFLLRKGAVSLFFRDSFELLFHLLPIWGTGYPSAIFNAHWELPHFIPLMVKKLFPFFLCNSVLWFYFYSRPNEIEKKHLQTMVLMACILNSQMIIYLMRSDMTHYYNSTPLLAPLATLFLIYLCNSSAQAPLFKSTNFLALLAFGFPCFVILWKTPYISPVINGIRNYYLTSDQKGVFPAENWETGIERIGKIYPIPLDMQEVGSLINEIQKRVSVNGYYFDMTPNPLYFFVNRLNPTRYPLISYLSSPFSAQACLEQLSSNPPHAILVDHRFFERKDLGIMEPVFDWVGKNYRSDIKIGELNLLIKNGHR